MKKHTKHVSLERPSGGRFHRNEIGFIGAPCGIIQSLMHKLSDALSDFNLGVMDADHGESKSSLSYQAEYTDKIGYHQVNFYDQYIEYSLRTQFDHCDALLINGNHFKTAEQIVIINDKKRDSLSRKIDRLDNVAAFIIDEGSEKPFSFLADKIDGYNDIPILKITDIEKIVTLIRNKLADNIPTLSGLLLYGGKSSRMGKDKGQIDYHGMPHVEYLRNLLGSFCSEVMISVSKETDLESEHILKDTFTGLGPFGGILSAFRHDPNRAYITLPCDVPFIDKAAISKLIEHRDPSKMATCFHNQDTGFPEPLITIWEPRSYPRLLHFLTLGYSCPRKVLINSDINEIMPQSQDVLFNANTPQESLMAIEKLS